MSANQTIDDVIKAMDNSLEMGDVDPAVYQTEIEVEQPSALPQLDVSTYSSQIFWLVLTFAALYLLVSRSALPRIHEVVSKRKHCIERDIQKAEQLSDDARKAEVSYIQVQQDARDKADALISQALQQAEENKEARNNQTDVQISAMLSESEQALVSQRLEVQHKLLSVGEDIALALVKELSGTAPDADAKQLISAHMTS